MHVIEYVRKTFSFPILCFRVREKISSKTRWAKHLAMYKMERDEVTHYWTEIKGMKQAGGQVTDLVLHKLLLYTCIPVKCNDKKGRNVVFYEIY